jgi:SAM-dependent methyltransferase
VTTPDRVTEAMLDLAAVKPGDRVIDLGSGDGRIVIAAARRGADALGVEIDPRLVAESRENARRAGVADRARFAEQDLFATDLSGATVVTMYLLPDVNLKLRPAILALRPGTRVASHDWDMGEWKPDRILKVDVPEKSIGLEKSSRIFLWIVPARVDGLWCAGGASLRLRQSFQEAQGVMRLEGAAPVSLAGRLDGAVLELRRRDGPASGGLRLSFDGATGRALGADGGLAPAKDLAWQRATGTTCAGS